MDGQSLATEFYFDNLHTDADYFSSPQIVKNDRGLEISLHRTENIEAHTSTPNNCNESMGNNHKSDMADKNEVCTYLDQTLPIKKKIEDLNSKVQNLKNEHKVLCTELKGLNVESFPGSEVSCALQSLGMEHEVLKSKYQEETEILKKKYLDECIERRRLYNEVIELKGNIRVFCRCRPLNASEISNGSTSVVDFDSSQENELQIVCSDSSKKIFKFDHVFRPEDDQETVFAQTAPIVISVLDGYNVCIFAYGQTGTGKTFTMEGTTENRGVNYRTLEELFRLSHERNRFMKYGLFVSMLEVYNEKIRDLLVDNPSQPVKKLEIKQSAEGTQEVPGLVEAQVRSIGEVWELFSSGSRARSVGSTNANELSSRSHCLVRVSVVGENLINGHKTKSNLWLVDLAGSERVGKIEVEGERLKESQFINKSLSAIGDVISALSSKSPHIPYRNSKLTHMLQNSLGGDCKTLMFLQISPSSSDSGETLCSLNFASRVRGVEHGPARKQTEITELFKYKQLAEKAKQDEKETKKLQENVQSLQLRLSAREHICKNLQDKVKDLENQLAEERKARLKQESRTLSTISSQSSALPALSHQSLMTIPEKKPPLAPSRLSRLPLRGITNIMPPSSPVQKTRKSMIPFAQNKGESTTFRMPFAPNKGESTTFRMPFAPNKGESTAFRVPTITEGKGKGFLRPRRGSIAVKPSTITTNQALQPRRRASIATFRPEPTNMSTPLNRSTALLMSDRLAGRKSALWDQQKVWRSIHTPSKVSPSATIEQTPVASQSRRFMSSPPSHQAGSWVPKHPTVIALQKKQLVWSPLKMKAMKSSRRSFVP